MFSNTGSGDGRSGLAEVVMRAVVDREFRRGLFDDPHATIFAVFGMRLPAGFRLKFIEKGEDVDLLIVLPDAVDDDCGLLALDWLHPSLGGRGAAPFPTGPVAAGMHAKHCS